MPNAPSTTATGWLAPRPAPRLLDRTIRRMACWCPMRVAIITVAIGLVLHEAIYWATGGADFPFTVIFNGSLIFALSHGGLDALAVGVLVISVLHILNIARDHATTQ